jgi:hypothetical protein
MLNVWNCSKNLKMGEIGLKLGEIVKIGWNRVKTRFQDRFNDFIIKHKLSLRFPPTLGVQWLLAIGYYRTKAKSRSVSHTQRTKLKSLKF